MLELGSLNIQSLGAKTKNRKTTFILLYVES